MQYILVMRNYRQILERCVRSTQSMNAVYVRRKLRMSSDFSFLMSGERDHGLIVALFKLFVLYCSFLWSIPLRNV